MKALMKYRNSKGPLGLFAALYSIHILAPRFDRAYLKYIIAREQLESIRLVSDSDDDVPVMAKQNLADAVNKLLEISHMMDGDSPYDKVSIYEKATRK